MLSTSPAHRLSSNSVMSSGRAFTFSIAHMFFDPALAYKFTLRRPARSVQGSIGENDTFGTQQHASLLDVEIP